MESEAEHNHPPGFIPLDGDLPLEGRPCPVMRCPRGAPGERLFISKPLTDVILTPDQAIRKQILFREYHRVRLMFKEGKRCYWAWFLAKEEIRDAPI